MEQVIVEYSRDYPHLEEVLLVTNGFSVYTWVQLTSYSITLIETNDPYVGMIRVGRKISGYKIKFTSVEDLIVADTKYISNSRTPEIRPEFAINQCRNIKIYIRAAKVIDNVTELDIRTRIESRLPMQLSSIWQSQLCSISIQLMKLEKGDTELARDYYLETICSINNSENITQIIAILNEFAVECICDVTLKTIFFNSKELFITIFHLFVGALKEPALLTMEELNAAEILSSPTKSKLNRRGRGRTSVDDIVRSKMKLCHAILKVLVNVLYGSDSIPSRFSLFATQMRPYDLNSWFEMLLINIAKTVAHSCKHKFQSLSRDQDINDVTEVAKSLETMSKVFGSKLSTAIAPSVTSSLKRSEFRDLSYSNNMTSLMENKESLEIVAIQQSIQNLQVILMYFLCNSCVSGQYIASNIAIHRSNIETPLRVERFGDSVVQFSNWENFIEAVITKLSESLDDFLSLNEVVQSVEKRIRSRKYSENTDRSATRRALGDLEVKLEERRSVSGSGLPRGSRSNSLSVDVGEEYSLYSPHSALVDRIRVPPSPSNRLGPVSSTSRLRPRSESVEFNIDIMSRQRSQSLRGLARDASFDQGDSEGPPRPNSDVFDANLYADDSEYECDRHPIFRRDSGTRVQFVDDNNNNADLFTWSRFETQELMIYHTCWLLRNLALDNPKIRHFLKNDMDTYWFEIMHTFNLLFPRPDDKSYIQRKEKTASSIEYANAPTNLFHRASKSILKSAKKEFPDEILDRETNGKRNESNKNYPALLLRDYGSSMYPHLNEKSRELLLLSRRAIEDIVRVLELNVSLVLKTSTSEDDAENSKPISVMRSLNAESKNSKKDDSMDSLGNNVPNDLLPSLSIQDSLTGSELNLPRHSKSPKRHRLKDRPPSGMATQRHKL